MVKKSKKSASTARSTNELLLAIVLSLLLGLGGGYALGFMNNDNQSEQMITTMMEDEHSEDSHNQDSTTTHMHETYEFIGDNVPSVQLMVEEDAKSGYNVKLMTQNFTFTPDSVNKENVMGEGHAHLYIDGEKIARLYGPYFHYDGTFEGTKTFKVTLNANDHSEYAINGMPITAELAVTHDSDDPDHMHD